MRAAALAVVVVTTAWLGAALPSARESTAQQGAVVEVDSSLAHDTVSAAVTGVDPHNVQIEIKNRQHFWKGIRIHSTSGGAAAEPGDFSADPRNLYAQIGVLAPAASTTYEASFPDHSSVTLVANYNAISTEGRAAVGMTCLHIIAEVFGGRLKAAPAAVKLAIQRLTEVPEYLALLDAFRGGNSLQISRSMLVVLSSDSGSEGLKEALRHLGVLVEVKELKQLAGPLGAWSFVEMMGSILKAVAEGGNSMGTLTFSYRPQTTEEKPPPLTDQQRIKPVLDALAARDASSLERLVTYTDVRCETAPVVGVGARPRCPPGVPNDTDLQMFLVDNCEATQLFPGEVESFLKPLMNGRVLGVLKLSTAGPASYLSASYAVVWEMDDHQTLFALDRDGRLIRHSHACARADEVVRGELANGGVWLVPPAPDDRPADAEAAAINRAAVAAIQGSNTSTASRATCASANCVQGLTELDESGKRGLARLSVFIGASDPLGLNRPGYLNVGRALDGTWQLFWIGYPPGDDSQGYSLPGSAYVCSDGRLNVRSSPGLDASIVGQVDIGARIEVQEFVLTVPASFDLLQGGGVSIRRGDGWFRISAPTVGWVSGAYTAPLGSVCLYAP